MSGQADMARNIVICCDGTANEFTRDATNVIRLFSCMVQEPERQIALYQPGLGTIEAAGALTRMARWATRLLGQAFGYGLEREMVQAYASLMRFYRPGDRVYLFGFSRGAYTVRAVAAMVHLYGVLRPGQEVMVPYAIRMAANRDEIALLEERAARLRETFQSPRREIHFVGVWDTVSSVGWVENPLRLPYTASNPSIRIGRHAVAIDERRAFFRTNLWRKAKTGPAGPDDLRQVWFPGVHSDVGGGYRDSEGGLSKFALEWMAGEAAKAGLLLRRAPLDQAMGRAGGLSPADPQAMMHNSLTPGWWPAEFLPKRHFNWATKQEERRMNLFRRRTVPQGALVHEVAWQRAGYAVPDGAVKVASDPVRCDGDAAADGDQPRCSPSR